MKTGTVSRVIILALLPITAAAMPFAAHFAQTALTEFITGDVRHMAGPTSGPAEPGDSNRPRRR